MLAGLPETYKPMIMGLESSGVKISADSIKTKLLQEGQNSESSTFFIYKKLPGKFTSWKGVRCFNCNKHGHFANVCRAPKKTQSPDKNEENKGFPDKTEDNEGFIAAFSASSQSINPDVWYVDSGASMTNRSDWMYDVQSPPISSITVASKTLLSVKSRGRDNLLVKREQGPGKKCPHCTKACR